MTTAVDDVDQRELRAAARGFFERYSDEKAVRTTMASADGFDRRLWTQMATELNLQGLLIPVRFGGNQMSFAQLQIVMEEMGRALVCAPYLSSAVLSVSALLAAGADQNAELLTAIAEGARIVAMAFTDHRGGWAPHDDAVLATPGDHAWNLDGRRRFVLDAAAADTMLVAAATADGPGLFEVDAAHPGCVATPMETLDMTRRQATVTFNDVPGKLIADATRAKACVTAALNAGLAALASEQVGGARRLLEMSVEYAKVREQFGRPIGSFQAIKHKCADMLVDVECSTSAAHAAGAAIDECSNEAGLLASLAKAYCSEAYCHVAAENIQIHGGIGFTWEHPAHLYFRRAKSTEMLLGTPAAHRERMLEELGL